MALFVGIDTSNYTTSLAITDEKGNLIVDKRMLLSVKPGTIGLRQSEAVFQHIKNFPLLINEVFDKINKNEIKAIGVSLQPRPVTTSYMPVFQVGKTLADTLASALEIPLINTTHQEGHIMAGIWSCGQKLREKFITIHISGGTTEILEVSLKGWEPIEFSVDKLGGTNDLHAGQFIDRVGVKIGLEFPAGPHLEQLAAKSINPYPIPIAVKGLNVSFSGPESHAQRLLAEGANIADLARGVESCLVKSLDKLIRNVYGETKQTFYLLVGGVASNKYLRETLKNNLKENLSNITLAFAKPRYSSDNAVGVSIIAQSGMRKGGRS